MGVDSRHILFYSEIGGFQGGIERFLFDAATALREAGWCCSAVFERPGRDSVIFAGAFDRVGFGADTLAHFAADAGRLWIHKCADARIWQRFSGKLPVMLYIHDHDLYCFRRHKYYPVTRCNCTRAAASFACLPCGMAARHPGNFFRFRRNLDLSRRADLVFAGSDFMLGNLVANNFDPARLRKLSPLIALGNRAVQARSPEKMIPDEIVYAGQLVRGKGVDLLIDAFAAMSGERHLTIVGDGGDRQMLENKVRKAGLEHCVAFTGFVTDPGVYYRQAAAAVFPSRWQEPFGMTGPEAMSYGVPVAGFDIGGVSEWLHDGENGILVPAGDIAALAGALRRLLDEPLLAAKLGGNGRRWAKEFTRAVFARNFERMVEI